MEEFDFVEFAKDIEYPAILLSAIRLSGKTHLTSWINYIWKETYKFDCVFLFSDTAELNKGYPYISPNFHFDGYKPDIVEKVLKKQKYMIKKYRDDAPEKIPKILFLFDDCVADKKIFYCKTLVKLAIEGRHYHCGFIMNTQYLHLLCPAVRSNVNLLIVFKSFNYRVQNAIVEQYLGVGDTPKKEAFKFFNDTMNEEYLALIIAVYKCQKANCYDDYVYTFKAPEKDPPKFRLGNECYWKLEHGCVDEDLDGSDISEALSNYSKKNPLKKNIKV